MAGLTLFLAVTYIRLMLDNLMGGRVMTDLARYCQQRYYAWLDSQGIKIVDGFLVDDECKEWVKQGEGV